jgi:SAM-dependent MidA family methyltransferase
MNERAADTSDSTSLAARLRTQIERTGPITFRDWMAAALYDERAGYYNRADRTRWGRAGDYRTSPERSPLFAATCARYFAKLYEELGAPETFAIIEAGAGDGHFAAGALATLAHEHPRVFAATRYLIDEQSAEASARARTRLASFAAHIAFRPLTETDVRTGIIFANELLDALPVHRVVRRDGQLRELCVKVNGAGDFEWVECELSTPRLAEHFARLRVSLAEGQQAEVNLAAEDWLARAAAALERGYVVLFDYGAQASELYDASVRPEGTLRAFRRHRLHTDMLARPGEQDLTTTVDWTQMEQTAARLGLHTTLFARQDDFLLRAGLLAQLEQMSARLPTEAERIALRVSARDMILPGGMSQSFQVLVLRK